MSNAELAGKVSERNMFNLGVGVVVAFFAVVLFQRLLAWLGNPAPAKPPEDLENLAIYAAIVLLGIGAFLFGRKFTPVKLSGASKDAITITIRNDEYARYFEQFNEQIILKRLCWWQRIFWRDSTVEVAMPKFLFTVSSFLQRWAKKIQDEGSISRLEGKPGEAEVIVEKLDPHLATDPYTASMDKRWKEMERERQELQRERQKQVGPTENESARNAQVTDTYSFGYRIALRVKSNPTPTALLASCLTMVLAVLFPPFQQELPVPGGVLHRHAGFHFLFASPANLTINVGLLALELGVIGFIAVALYVILRDK